MINFILLTKTYNESDFINWYSYHKKLAPNARVIVIDNESPVDIKKHISAGDIYHCLKGFPNQYEIYSKIVNERKFVNEGDWCIFIDDDEYIYFNDKNDKDRVVKFEDVIEKYVHNNVIMIPQIFMSTEKVLSKRANVPLPVSHIYRRSDQSTQCKCIVKVESPFTYDFSMPTPDDGIFGHVPALNGRHAGTYMTWWKNHNDNDFQTRYYWIINKTFANVDFSSNLRLYHYHIKSKEDWDIKVKRGSAATKIPWYDNLLEKNMFYGGYDKIDKDMRDLYERITTDV